MLLSIKPEFVEYILEGKKKYEFRKSKPKENIGRIIFYASSPQKQVVGEATVETIWSITKSVAGITKNFYFSYYEGKHMAVAYKLKEVIRYNHPKALSDYGVSQAPQSFIYLD